MKHSFVTSTGTKHLVPRCVQTSPVQHFNMSTVLHASLVMVTLPLIHNVSMSLSDVTRWLKSNSCCPSTNTRKRLCSQWISICEEKQDEARRDEMLSRSHFTCLTIWHRFPTATVWVRYSHVSLISLNDEHHKVTSEDILMKVSLYNDGKDTKQLQTGRK